ncbi:hypothetical protein PLICRDRAFT_96384 [Plicaturopsis crispa FD-325 SS-3]|nr:hypothetical protein PLICRDRAFT_96384 [Plicaturopsis crispa FD-325 SS-3]
MDLASLLRCPCCEETLRNPTTLNCGHTVCAIHVLDACPLPECSPKLHPSSPAVTFVEESDEEPVVSPSRVDVTVSRILDLAEPTLKEVQAELTCEICFSLLHEPLTTPCQHTFCARCLHRALDHSPACPLCRQRLPGFAFFQFHPPNALLMRLVALFPSPEPAVNPSSPLDTPIFVCQLSFPGVPTLLHFFEPRYRLMLRRCLEKPCPAFGMLMPGDSQAWGTMLEIRSVQMLPDGRSMVETWGSWRFRLAERGMLDGYMVGRVERIDDIEDIDDDDDEGADTAQLMATCQAFLAELRQGTAPWVVQRLNNAYGPQPQDPSAFSFWVALILPIDDAEKAKLLPIRSARLRLRLCVYWIEQFRSTWWFSSGCVVL